MGGRCRGSRSFPGALPRVWRVPARNPIFTGRADDLAALAAALASGPTVTVRAVRGMGGVGKTQLAAEFAYAHAADYDLVYWIAAEEPAFFPDQFTVLAGLLGLDPVPDPDGLRPPHVLSATSHFADSTLGLLIPGHPFDRRPPEPGKITRKGGRRPSRVTRNALLRVILPGSTLERREDGRFAARAPAADRCGAEPVGRVAGTGRAPTPPWPGGSKSGRRRPGAQRSPEGPADGGPELCRVPVTASVVRRFPKIGTQLGPARSARL